MRLQANKGLFPFYTSLEHQNRFNTNCCNCPFGIYTTQTELPPFQLEFDGNLATAATWEIIGCDGSSQALSSSLISKKCLKNGKTILHFDGGPHGLSLDCGYYYLVIVFGSVTYYSEIIRVANVDNDTSMYKLIIANSTNLGGFYYQFTNYQYIWLKTHKGTPELVINEEVKEDGFGKQIVKYSRTEEICVLSVPYIPDVLLKPLTTIRNHDDIGLIDSEYNVFTVENYSFSSEIQDSCFNIGTIRFTACVDIYTGCEEDASVTTCIES